MSAQLIEQFSENILSPVLEITTELGGGVRLWIKRDDLIHSAVSGNKWRKLKYNLIAAQKENRKTLITKGGAFSNHIYATAAAGQLFGFQTIGIIRGERVRNPTLAFAESCGMKLVFVERDIFRTIDAGFPFENLGIDAADSCFLPEGGTNELAIEGAAEMANESIAQLGFVPDYFCLSAGTGGTAAGLINGLQGKSNVLVFSALKGDFLKNEVGKYLYSDFENWSLQTDYHFGGYAKFNQELITFINDFKQNQHIPLDPVYTGKMIYGVFEKIRKGHFPTGAKILAIHTGGLQGNIGFCFRHGDLLV